MLSGCLRYFGSLLPSLSQKTENREKTAIKIFARKEATTLTKANSEKH
jgi:hypothetical protein